jgi:hypothetical protein
MSPLLDRAVPAKVHIGWSDIIQGVMIPLVIIVIPKHPNLFRQL